MLQEKVSEEPPTKEHMKVVGRGVKQNKKSGVVDLDENYRIRHEAADEMPPGSVEARLHSTFSV